MPKKLKSDHSKNVKTPDHHLNDAEAKHIMDLVGAVEKWQNKTRQGGAMQKKESFVEKVLETSEQGKGRT